LTLFEEQFEDDFLGYQTFNPETIINYDRVIVFYSQELEAILREAGYEWPELKPEEAVRIYVENTEWILVNYTNTRFRNDTVELFLNHHELIDTSVVSLTSFYPEIETDLTALLSYEFCQIKDLNNDTVKVGFPNAPSRLPNTGLITVQVLFIDFPDQQGVKTQAELSRFFEDYIEGIERFYDIQSLGRVQFEWRLEPGFVRIPRNFANLRMTRENSFDLDPILRQAIQISDSNVDYTDIDMVIVFLNPDIPEELADVSPAWPLEGEWGIKTSEKTIFNATFIAGDAVRIGYPIIAHEIGHLFGLIDLYKFNWLEDNPERDYWRHFEFTGIFDFMSFAPPHHEYGDNRDMLGWQRFLLNWITGDEIHCLTNDEPSFTSHLLSPVADQGETRMIVTRLSENQVLVTEIRAKNQYCEICSGGIYNYLVDTTLRNGHGAIQILRPDHSTMNLFQDAYLSSGQSFTYENVTVSFEGQRRDQVIVTVEIKD
jgi:M6 family metalloprotease-like protein